MMKKIHPPPQKKIQSQKNMKRNIPFLFRYEQKHIQQELLMGDI